MEPCDEEMTRTIEHSVQPAAPDPSHWEMTGCEGTGWTEWGWVVTTTQGCSSHWRVKEERRSKDDEQGEREGRRLTWLVERRWG
jgi:hypothetical protein